MIEFPMQVFHCLCLFFPFLFIRRFNMAEATPKPRCFLCGRNHALKHCLTFRKMLIRERREALNGQDVCPNCFGYGHSRSSCTSVNRCQTCQAKHHTMIHRHRSEIESSFEEVSVPDPLAAQEGQQVSESLGEHKRRRDSVSASRRMKELDRMIGSL